MLDIFLSKFHELIPIVENKDLHQLHAHLEQTPSKSHIQKFHQTHNISLGPNQLFFYDDLGRLTGTELLLRGVTVAVIDPFFIPCDCSPDTIIIHGITSKLMIDIHSTLNLLRCQFEAQIYNFYMIFQVS